MGDSRMDFLDAREHGCKPGSYTLSISEQNINRRNILRRMALETIDLQRDPFFIQNHVGTFECRLCYTVHRNEGCYLAHTQGKRHKFNMTRRCVANQTHGTLSNLIRAQCGRGVDSFYGYPGYYVRKQYDRMKREKSILFVLRYTGLVKGRKPL